MMTNLKQGVMDEMECVKTECKNCGKAVPSTVKCEVGPSYRLEYMIFKCYRRGRQGLLFDAPIVYELRFFKN